MCTDNITNNDERYLANNIVSIYRQGQLKQSFIAERVVKLALPIIAGLGVQGEEEALENINAMKQENNFSKDAIHSLIEKKTDVGEKEESLELLEEYFQVKPINDEIRWLRFSMQRKALHGGYKDVCQAVLTRLNQVYPE